jgi:hypothetical protein
VDNLASGSGIERWEPPRSQQQLPPDPPREDKGERTVKSNTEAVRLFADYTRLALCWAQVAQVTGECQGRNILG